jgi:hypothetical protein
MGVVTLGRGVLAACFAVLIVSAARRGGASGSGDVELGGYSGRSSGTWACGPTAAVRYGGIGAQARVHPLAGAPERQHGLALTVGVAAEAHSYSLIACASGGCGGGGAVVPPRSVVAGGAGEFGYDDRYFGFHGGALAWQRFANGNDPAPTWSWVPQLLLRAGPLDGVHGELGLGSYDVATILRPGAYLGLSWAPLLGWECSVHTGVHQTFDGESGVRASLGLRVPLAARVKIGFTLAASSGEGDSIQPEGQLVLVLGL